jgi:GH15 family glucan-1,4-alpha-glucosidase
MKTLLHVFFTTTCIAVLTINANQVTFGRGKVQTKEELREFVHKRLYSVQTENKSSSLLTLYFYINEENQIDFLETFGDPVFIETAKKLIKTRKCCISPELRG